MSLSKNFLLSGSFKFILPLNDSFSISSLKSIPIFKRLYKSKDVLISLQNKFPQISLHLLPKKLDFSPEEIIITKFELDNKFLEFLNNYYEILQENSFNKESIKIFLKTIRKNHFNLYYLDKKSYCLNSLNSILGQISVLEFEQRLEIQRIFIKYKFLEFFKEKKSNYLEKIVLEQINSIFPHLKNTFLNKKIFLSLTFYERNELLYQLIPFDICDDILNLLLLDENKSEFQSALINDPPKAFSILPFLFRFTNSIKYFESKKIFFEINSILSFFNKNIINFLIDEKKFSLLFKNFNAKIFCNVFIFLQASILDHELKQIVDFNLKIVERFHSKNFFLKLKHFKFIQNSFNKQQKYDIYFFENNFKKKAIKAMKSITEKNNINLMYTLSNIIRSEFYVLRFHKNSVRVFLEFLKKIEENHFNIDNIQVIEKILKILLNFSIRTDYTLYSLLVKKISQSHSIIKTNFFIQNVNIISETVIFDHLQLNKLFKEIANIFENYDFHEKLNNNVEKLNFSYKLLDFIMVMLYEYEAIQNKEIIQFFIDKINKNKDLENDLSYEIEKLNTKWNILLDPKNSKTTLYKKKIINKTTLAEKEIKLILERQKVKFHNEVTIGTYRVDFLIRNNEIIEYFGLNHFYLDKHVKEFKKQDLFRIKILEILGFKVKVISVYTWKKFRSFHDKENYLINFLKI